jgi:hypothetical protein
VERWQKPPNITYLGEDPDTALIEGDRMPMRRGLKWRINDQETYERFKQGWVCWNCQEPQPSPMPERCVLCPFEIREYQHLHMRLEVRPEGPGDRPQTSLHDELDRLDDWGERHFHQTKTGIVVPRGVS